MDGLAGTQGRIAVIGSGIAGLICALELAPRPVVLLTRAGLGQESSSLWAQGGIAACVGADDSVDLHLADTLSAGAGLCDAKVARGILAEGPDAIAALESHGVRFDRTGQGGFALGLEAAHSRRRILHVGGDGSGAGITRALADAVLACPSITVMDGADVRRLLVRDGCIAGVLLADGRVLETARVVMATGGIGGLFEASTNPAGNFGQGVMMAARAGARLSDMEFVQFHPTALNATGAPLPLISEAVRGEGAVLVDESGRRFMADVPGAELAPRDVVARAIQSQIDAGRGVYLDARAALGQGFTARFPGIDAICKAAGIDPAHDPIPVRPAAHYHMGGIDTDAQARTSLRGLWAIGECAATGLHGANRLASNSLLEAVVMARRAAVDVAVHVAGDAATERGAGTLPVRMPPMVDPAAVRRIASRALGLRRDAEGLRAAIAELLPLVEGDGPEADPACVALSVAVFALLRQESRGGHARTDFPDTAAETGRRRMTFDELRALANGLRTRPLLRSA
ncbi:L-aspartate oxidase [Mameliella alba]|nr:L-aspartate oxidase [Mameliella alba]MBY6168749.1 L-aspartate oxidase [Mameliella alba]MBY6174030.1 L-aspartate oxidase [Mameliella alba]